MTVPKGKPNEPANAEIVTVEQAILCANRHIHFGDEYCRAQDPAELLRIADKAGQAWRLDEASRDCGPHSYATRERIVTAWTEKPL